MGRWAQRYGLVLLLVNFPFAARADGPARLVKNINQTIDRRGSSNTYAFTPAGSYLYFLAADSTHGPELWRSDRTPSGTVPWRALGFAPELSNATQILSLDDDLVAVGNGVWRTDGTAAGTVQLAEGDGWWAVDAGPTVFLFRGNELWGSDGSPSGTRLLATLGSHGGETRALKNLATGGGRMFFTFCDDKNACELWFSDGSAAGTRLVAHLQHADDIQEFLVAGSGLFASIGVIGVNGRCELLHSDGSSDGTWRVAFPPPPGERCYDGVRHLVPAGNGVFFTGCSETTGCEPWHSDGSVAGTIRLADIDPGPGDGLPEPDDDSPEFVVVDGVFYFLAYAPNTGMELWRSDGSPSGTYLVKDINPGPADGFILRYDFFSSYRAVFTVVGHSLYFVASDGIHGFELWRTDGTPDGTDMVADAIPGSAGVFDFFASPCDCDANPTNRLAVSNALWFVTCKWDEEGEPEDTWQLWRSDGTATGTAQMADGIDARFLVAVGDAALFAFYDEPNQTSALGRADSAHADTVAALPGGPESWSSFPDGIIFTSRSADIGSEPWWSDGTPAGTYLLRDIGGQDASASPSNLIAFGDLLLFSADDGVHGRELWRSDATEEGTTLVADINPGAAAANPTRPIRLGNAVLFAADDGVHGVELWRSDGTPAGTRIVADINSGPGGSAPDRFIVVGIEEQLITDDGVHGRELWRSNGTAAGTALVRDIRPGMESSVGDQDNGARAVLDGRLYFSADDGVHGFALWESDGTPDGTVLRVELGDGDQDGASDFFAAGGRLYFSLYLADSVAEWETDGSDSGTRRLDSLWELFSPASAGGVTYALGEGVVGGQLVDGVWRLDSNGVWEPVATNFLFFRLFAVGNQLFSLKAWGAALWRFGVGFEPPDPGRGNWIEFSDFAVADRRILLYDDYYNALWATDGTAPGTSPLQYLPGADPLRSDAYTGATYSIAFTPAGDHIFFSSNSGTAGEELWAVPVAALTEVCTDDCTGAPPPADTPTPTSMTPLCTGDCDHSGTVTISELIVGVNIALGSLPVTACPAFENGQGAVDVAQLITSVNAALGGCAG